MLHTHRENTVIKRSLDDRPSSSLSPSLLGEGGGESGVRGFLNNAFFSPKLIPTAKQSNKAAVQRRHPASPVPSAAGAWGSGNDQSGKSGMEWMGRGWPQGEQGCSRHQCGKGPLHSKVMMDYAQHRDQLLWM